MKVLRAIWGSFGTLALLAALMELALKGRTTNGNAIAGDLIVAVFSGTMLASAVMSGRSAAALKVLAVCWVGIILYCGAFIALVGFEFGRWWLVAATALLLMASSSLWILTRHK
jgi:hypothetical protein